jgi:hypothetical protein
MIDSSWSAQARAILERSCAYYGGWRLWRAVRLIRLAPQSLWGGLPRLKGAGVTFALPALIEIAPHEGTTTFFSYPNDQQIGVFERGAVTLRSRHTGQAIALGPRHRETFDGWAKYRRWSWLDALYFFGYALWHYHTLPFSLGAGRLLGLRQVGRGATALDVLSVELPPDVPTHSRRQAFYIDGDGRIVRHDYRAEVVGRWAAGAHFWRQERRVQGFPIALERHVRPRLGATVLPLTVLHAIFADAELVLAASDPTPPA